MPLVWLVYDGPRPYNTRGTGHLVTLEMLSDALAGYRVSFCPHGPPTFNKETPSWSPMHVVVEVRQEDGVYKGFDKTGFYNVEDMTPAKAKKALGLADTSD